MSVNPATIDGHREHVYSVHMTESRERILDLACDLYLKVGMDGFSMRKLAQKVGVTAPALYRHFPNREALLLEVMNEGYKILLQYLTRALRGATPEERFRLAGEAELEFALANPRFFRMHVAFSDLVGLEETPSELQEMAQSVHQFWMDRVREAIEAGILEDRDPQALGLVLWSQAFGLISLHVHGLIQVTDDQFRALFRRAFHDLFRGIATPEFRARIEANEPPDLEDLPSCIMERGRNAS